MVNYGEMHVSFPGSLELKIDKSAAAVHTCQWGCGFFC